MEVEAESSYFYKLLTYNAQKCYNMLIHGSKTATLIEKWELKLLILIHNNRGDSQPA